MMKESRLPRALPNSSRMSVCLTHKLETGSFEPKTASILNDHEQSGPTRINSSVQPMLPRASSGASFDILRANQSIGKSSLPKIKGSTLSQPNLLTAGTCSRLQNGNLKHAKHFLKMPLCSESTTTLSSLVTFNHCILPIREDSYEGLSKSTFLLSDPTYSDKQCSETDESVSGFTSSNSCSPNKDDASQHAIRLSRQFSVPGKATDLMHDAQILPYDVTNKSREEITVTMALAPRTRRDANSWHARHNAAATKARQYASERLRLESKVSYVGGVQVQHPCIEGSLLHRLECGHLVYTTRPECCAKNCQVSVSNVIQLRRDETLSCSLCIAKLVQDEIESKYAELLNDKLKGKQLLAEEVRIRAETLDKGDHLRTRGLLCIAVLRSEDVWLVGK